MGNISEEDLQAARDAAVEGDQEQVQLLLSKSDMSDAVAEALADSLIKMKMNATLIGMSDQQSEVDVSGFALVVADSGIWILNPTKDDEDERETVFLHTASAAEVVSNVRGLFAT